MKKLFIIILITYAATQSMAQTKSFEGSIGGGPSYLVSGGSGIFGVGLNLQGEYFAGDHFSAYGSAGYHYLFSTDGGGHAGYIPFEVGPRVYFSPSFFAGAGIGVAVLTAEGESVTGFHYHPHIGYNSKKTQIIFGYSAISKEATVAFLDLGFMFKF